MTFNESEILDNCYNSLVVFIVLAAFLSMLANPVFWSSILTLNMYCLWALKLGVHVIRASHILYESHLQLLYPFCIVVYAKWLLIPVNFPLINQEL